MRRHGVPRGWIHYGRCGTNSSGLASRYRKEIAGENEILSAPFLALFCWRPCICWKYRPSFNPVSYSPASARTAASKAGAMKNRARLRRASISGLTASICPFVLARRSTPNTPVMGKPNWRARVRPSLSSISRYPAFISSAKTASPTGPSKPNLKSVRCYSPRAYLRSSANSSSP